MSERKYHAAVAELDVAVAKTDAVSTPQKKKGNFLYHDYLPDLSESVLAMTLCLIV